MGTSRGRPAAHRAVRPRYGRMVSALGSVGVTAVSVLGAAGVLPGGGGAQASAVTQASAVLPDRGAMPVTGPGRAAATRELETWESAPARALTALGTRVSDSSSEALPERSGTGRRVVFDIGAQRVWLVRRGDRVDRTYLVSGSLTDNLRPGTYEVYSTSRHAVGIDDSGTMQFMVRFAHGRRAAIGFHDIPVDDGRLVQTRDQLGTPQSHGCVRQWRPDARALWDFAPVGTKVVVTD